MFVSLSEAVQILKSGHIVGMPTETVYGLAGRIDSESAINEIFSTKRRPFFDPLIVHVAGVPQAKTLVREWSVAAEVLTKKFWPGPLTLILPKSPSVSGLITSGLDSVGVRCPAHPLAQQLLEKVEIPLAAPSANMFGHTSPTSAVHVEKEFVSAVPVLDGGVCQVGIESTVLLIHSNTNIFEISILREGQVLLSEIEKCMNQAGLNFKVLKNVSKSLSPGHLQHHYMPSVPLIYCRQIPRCEEHLRSALESSIKKIPVEVEGVRLRKPQNLNLLYELSLSADPSLAARELYQKLREISESKPDLIYFVEPQYFRDTSKNEHWQAIRDRLTKAASLILDEELA